MLVQRFKDFLSQEEGQTTTEYILILAVVATIIMQFKTKLKSVVMGLLDKVGNDANQAAEMGDS